MKLETKKNICFLVASASVVSALSMPFITNNTLSKDVAGAVNSIGIFTLIGSSIGAYAEIESIKKTKEEGKGVLNYRISKAFNGKVYYILSEDSWHVCTNGDEYGDPLYRDLKTGKCLPKCNARLDAHDIIYNDVEEGLVDIKQVDKDYVLKRKPVVKNHFFGKRTFR